MDETRCKKQVSGEGQWGGFHRHQCQRKVWNDGYCKQHHSDTVEARNKEREERDKRYWMDEKTKPYRQTIAMLNAHGFRKVAEYFEQRIKEIEEMG